LQSHFGSVTNRRSQDIWLQKIIIWNFKLGSLFKKWAVFIWNGIGGASKSFICIICDSLNSLLSFFIAKSFWKYNK
jgi:hypothetical protein